MPLLHKSSTVSFMFYKTGGLRLIQKTKIKKKGPGRPKIVKSVLLLSLEETESLAEHIFSNNPKKVQARKLAKKAVKSTTWKASEVEPTQVPANEPEVVEPDHEPHDMPMTQPVDQPTDSPIDMPTGEAQQLIDELNAREIGN